MYSINPERAGGSPDSFAMVAKKYTYDKMILTKVTAFFYSAFLLKLSWELMTICDSIGRLSVVSSSLGRFIS